MNEMMAPPPPMDTSRITRKWLDVAYADQSRAQKMDIYLPQAGDGPFPVLATIHGGAWLFGDKGDILNLPFMEGLKRGYAVVCMNYRLSGEAQFPCQIFDCKAAIRFLRANASRYQLDGSRIAAWGPSAGGHLAALLGTSAGVMDLEDPALGHPETSSAVQAVVDWCGPTQDFLKMDEQIIENGVGIPDHSQAESPESHLIGMKITEAPERVRFASPMSYITADVPPFLIQHGSSDPIVPVQQSIHFSSEIKRIAGEAKASLDIFKGAGHHGDPAFETAQNIDRVLDFADDILK